jgi:hypothetical protein
MGSVVREVAVSQGFLQVLRTLLSVLSHQCPVPMVVFLPSIPYNLSSRLRNARPG